MRFQGLRTVVYYVEDLDQAKTWWSTQLGFAPYFDQPFYVGFNVGGYELGLVPATDEEPKKRESLTYWGVPDIEAGLRELLAAGTSEFHPITDVGEGIKVAAVTDPFGNVVGIIKNPHFSLPAAG